MIIDINNLNNIIKDITELVTECQELQRRKSSGLKLITIHTTDEKSLVDSLMILKEIQEDLVLGSECIVELPDSQDNLRLSMLYKHMHLNDMHAFQRLGNSLRDNKEEDKYKIWCKIAKT
jgi:hypothetical protein